MNELALFAGAGGGILGGVLLGWRTVCAVELDAYARRVLLARQRDGCLPRFPIWDDVCTFDGHPWRGHVDVISGGFPCQDISCAGKGAGIDGERSGLWSEFARIIREVGPRYVFSETWPQWGMMRDGACFQLAPLVIHTHGNDCSLWPTPTRMDGTMAPMYERIVQIINGEQPGHGGGCRNLREYAIARRCSPRFLRGPYPEPNVGRVAPRVAPRMDRLKVIGNGQVPRVAAMAWRILSVTS